MTQQEMDNTPEQSGAEDAGHDGGAPDDAQSIGAATGGGTTTTGSDYGDDVTGAVATGKGEVGSETAISDDTNVGLAHNALEDDSTGSSRDAPDENIQGSSVQ